MFGESTETMRIHPVADIFPPMSPEGFAALKADIEQHGQREPIWTKGGAIIDGRHRWKACQEIGRECLSREYDGADLVPFVVSLNLQRRHLDSTQRAMVAANIANLSHGQKRTDTAIAVTQPEAAAIMNVSVDSVQRARTVIADGAPEMVAAVQSGSISVSAASEAVELDADTQRAIVEQVQAGRKPAEVIREYKPHVAQNSGNNEWYTPGVFIDAARAVMGRIDLDPASSEVANRTVRADKFFTQQDDGLTQEWCGAVWMNPPYAQPHCADFCARLCEFVDGGRIEQACVLVNNATETAWFQLLLAQCDAVCFVKGRVKFLDPEGNPGAPLQGQAILYFGEESEQFILGFSQFGRVLS